MGEVGLVGGASGAAGAPPRGTGSTPRAGGGNVKLFGLISSDKRRTRTKPCASPPPPPPKPAAVASRFVSISRPSAIAFSTSSTVFWDTAASLGSVWVCGLASGETATVRFSATESSPPSKNVSSTRAPASVTTTSPSFRTSPSLSGRILPSASLAKAVPVTAATVAIG